MKESSLTIWSSKTLIVVIAFLLFPVTKSVAQDIEPRRWTALPLGTNILGVGYARTNGKIFFDPLLQVEDGTFNNDVFALQYIHSFKLGNKLARLDVFVPFSITQWEGLLGGVATTVNRNGFADPRIRLSLNFIGMSAMNPNEMQEYLMANPKRTSFGVSIAVTLPLGQYFDENLLNLGQNRFIFRPQVGMVHHWGKWSYELTGSALIYTNNNNFSNGKTRKQNVVFAAQTHLIRQFKSRAWASLSLGYGLSGQSIVNSQPNNDDRIDVLGAFSLGFVLTKKQTVKLSYIRTETTKDIGADLNSIIMSWSTLF
ncbi:MAG: transporter [Psychroserpens sp.]|uniref:transporter n=1 Tax=Psychroserpens sp. TaxID=2020870 RepID=UPI003002B152